MVTAALINALKVVKKRLDEIKVVVNGPGSAGTAIIYMLLEAGVKHIIACDEYGILYKGREQGLIDHKKTLCDVTNKEDRHGNLGDALKGADVFIGVSVPNVLTADMIKTMAEKPVIFAMANPNPEIDYYKAKEAGAAVVSTGRSDFPNQVNNVLCFPAIFRGALDVRACDINSAMKIAAANAIAGLVSDSELSADYILPKAFDKRVKDAVSKAVSEAARRSGAARA